MHVAFRRIPLALVCLVAAFLAGRAAAGRSASSPAPAVSAREADPRRIAAAHETATASDPSADETAAPSDEAQLKEAVPRLAAQITSNARFDEFMEALRAWAALNPEAALAFAREQLNAYRSSSAVTTLLTDWARRDPRAAWLWAGEKFNEEGIHLDPVLSEIGKSDPKTAARHAAEIAEKHPQQAAGAYASALRGILHSGNHEAALQLMDQAKLPEMPDGLAGKYALADTFISLWAPYEPEKAAGWALALPAGSIARDRSLVNLSQNWAENHPDQAADFAASLPPGGERSNTLTQVLTYWLDQEPAKVTAWMDSHLDDPALDNAKAVMARRPEILAGNPAVALSWAWSIADENAREYSVGAVVSEWSKRDLWAAMDYLYNSPELPSGARENIIRTLTQIGRIPALE